MVQTRFRYSGYDIEAAGRLSFRYAFEDGPAFVEVIDFGAPFPAPDALGREAFEAAVRTLYVLAGVSYYKARAPETLDLNGLPFTPEQCAFFKETFVNGLAEFAYRNDVDVSGLRFVNAGPAVGPAGATGAAGRGDPDRGTVVLMGGGKDSLVSVETLRAADFPFRLFCVNPKRPMRDCAAAGDLAMVTVKRTIDPALIALNREPGVRNGHVPITAIVSMIAVVGAFVHGYRNIVLSNERSADEATLVDAEGREVNHQYSKGSHFERRLADYVREYVSPDIAYFSLLRPLSELHIASLFARADRYDAAFTSCNRAFTIATEAKARWCGDCAKCRFTSLMLAGFVPPARLKAMLGHDLLDDPAQLPGFEALLGLDAHKPWDCVGEVRESQVALLGLAEDARWRGHAVVQALAPRVAAFLPDAAAARAELMAPQWDRNAIPSAFEEALRARLG